MEQLTSLPEKWAIEQNRSELNDWFDENGQCGSTYSSTTCGDFFHYPKVGGNHLFPRINPEYTEITFEQFQRWVLNKNNVIEIW